MNPEKMTVDQLNAATDDLDTEIAKLRDKKRGLAEVRAKKLAGEQLALRTRHLKPAELEEIARLHQTAVPKPVVVGTKAKK